jgi:hypothetical protein
MSHGKMNFDEMNRTMGMNADKHERPPFEVDERRGTPGAGAQPQRMNGIG